MIHVLISDAMSREAQQIFERRGIQVDVRTTLSPDALKNIIGDYDGLAIRSSTKVTADLLRAARRLKVIGRAGIGVDNVDVPAATAAGIVVMNTPFGNSITTAEHALSMMLSLTRHIPQANVSTHAGKWEKSRFMGVELYGKTLGVLGCGNVGAIVADRALGLKMKVIAFDPFLSDARATDMGVEKVDLETLLHRADIITVHTPLTPQTRGILNRDAFKKCKKGVRIVNCARGGIVVEADLKEAILSGHVAGAALDVFEEEPATQNILFGLDNVICTPHLGASTVEAQEKVALQVAEQMSDFLIDGAVTHALNMPSISAQDAPRLKPYMNLAQQLGSFAGQILDAPLQSIHLEYHGAVAALNTRPLTAMVVASILKPSLDLVNMVNAPSIAKERGIEIIESFSDTDEMLRNAIIVTVTTATGTSSLKGALFGDHAPRIVEVEDVPVEASLAPHMLYIRNEDKPGLVGGLGTTLGDACINIADFRLGRIPGTNRAVALVSIDEPVSDPVFQKLSALPQIRTIKRLSF